MRIKASNMHHWVSFHSGILPLNAMAAIHRHLIAPGDRVCVGGVTYERV